MTRNLLIEELIDQLVQTIIIRGSESSNDGIGRTAGGMIGLYDWPPNDTRFVKATYMREIDSEQIQGKLRRTLKQRFEK